MVLAKTYLEWLRRQVGRVLTPLWVCTWGRRKYTGISNKPNCQRRVVGGNPGNTQYALDGFGLNLSQMVARTHRKGVTPPIGLRMRQAEVYAGFKQARLGG